VEVLVTPKNIKIKGRIVPTEDGCAANETPAAFWSSFARLVTLGKAGDAHQPN
jgi:hypothetical protein